MQCPHCQHDNPAQARFCLQCGGRCALTCAECGTELPADARFCLQCGHAVSAPPAALPRPTAPEAYTPKHLAEKILTSRSALEGERKQVTVLFADLKGSMELLADRDPEEARRLLDPVLERMMEAVHRYEGTVNQVMGDGIMALFGAPLAHEYHAVRACYAALRMQEAVKQYADEVRRTEGLAIHIRVGLNSGEVVVRSIGSDLRMDYTAVGQTTHLAARMEQAATPSTILLAPDTLQLAEGYVQVKALGPMAVKGWSAPVEVYELTGAGSARTRLQAAASRGLTKFVGRDAELETLRRTLEQAGSGYGQLAALVGEPGVGKSRLVWEFSHSHRTQGWLVLASGSVSFGKTISYLPVIELLKSYSGIDDRDDERRMREKVTGKLLTLAPLLQPLLAPLLSLLDVPVNDAQWQTLDAPQRRQRTLDALKRLLLRVSQEQPLFLVFEDLHWIDTETQALLDNLVDSLPTARIVLLVNYRPEYEHTWHRKTYYQQLRLDPLPPDSAEELLAALLGDHAELHVLKRALVERTEGNPLFVEESIRTLVESGVLAGERGAYRLVKPFESAQVPATVQAVLAARIDRLAPEDKRLLQAAAVIGKDVPYALLRAIAELSEAALEGGLSLLHAAEFLYETSLFPDREYTFKHALTHDVAYGSVLHDRRRALHARIVAAIEEVYADRLAEHVERLGHHAFHGEHWQQALLYLRQAGTKAGKRSAHREAVGYFEQAVDALGRLPMSPEASRQAIDIRFELRNSLHPLAEYRRLQAHLHEAEAVATALADPRRLAWVRTYIGNLAVWFGDSTAAVQDLERALAVAAEMQDAGLEALGTQFLATAHYMLGSYSRAVELLRPIVLTLDRQYATEAVGVGTLAVGLRYWLALTLAEQGEFADALALGEESCRAAAGTTNSYSAVHAPWTLGEIYVRKGDPELAVRLLTDALHLAEEYRILNLVLRIESTLGYVLTQVGRLPEAITLLEETIERATAIPELGAHSVRLTRLGTAYLLDGRPQDARAAADQAREVARRQFERGHETWALWLHGEISAQAEVPASDPAESEYHQALALAEELGMRPLAAHCHLGLGTLYQRAGRDEQAQAELTTAVKMYRAMKMTFWLERAEEALALLAC